MIGIKGVGMTGLAQILKDQGMEITGSDTKEYFFTEKVLKRLNIPYKKEFSVKNIPNDTQLVIHSTAFTEKNNEELAAAKEEEIPILSYPEALSELFNESWGTAVTGTHGKTTTTALIAEAVRVLGFDPKALVGSRVNQWKTNAVSGESPFFIIEADEHQNKLKYYNPWSLVITNIDYDHPDFYSEEEYYQAFYRLGEKWKERNFLLPRLGILNCDDKKTNRLREEINLSSSDNQWIITYGKEENCDWRMEETQPGKVKAGVKLPLITLPFEFKKRIPVVLKTRLMGEYNGMNVCAAASFLSGLLLSTVRLIKSKQISEEDKLMESLISSNEEVSFWQKSDLPEDDKGKEEWMKAMFDLIIDSLKGFQGTERRMQLKGKRDEIKVFDDYAHHPEEIKAVIEGLKKSCPKHKIYIVFQPHTYTRTKTFLKEFAEVLSKANKVFLLEVYASAREKEKLASSKDIQKRIGDKAMYFKDKKECLKFLNNYKFSKPAVMATVGAGDVWKIGEEWLKNK